MCTNGTALSHLIERRSIGSRAIVPEIGDCECRRVLDASVGAEARVRRKRIVSSINRGGNRQRRQLPISAQRFESWLITHPEVEAEVNVACVKLADLEPVVDAGRRALGQLPREAETRPVSAIDVDAGRTSTMREQADAQTVVRRSKPGLGEIDTRVVGRNEVTSKRTGLWNRSVAEDPATVKRAREKISYHSLHVQTPGTAEEVVIRDPALDLEEVDRVESSTHACLSRR